MNPIDQLEQISSAIDALKRHRIDIRNEVFITLQPSLLRVLASIEEIQSLLEENTDIATMLDAAVNTETIRLTAIVSACENLMTLFADEYVKRLLGYHEQE